MRGCGRWDKNRTCNLRFWSSLRLIVACRLLSSEIRSCLNLCRWLSLAVVRNCSRVGISGGVVGVLTHFAHEIKAPTADN
jgi:hypothetical protein